MKSKFIEWSFRDPETPSLLSFYCSPYGSTVTALYDSDGSTSRVRLNLRRRDLKELRDFLTKVLDMDIGYKKGMELNKGDYEELVKMVEEYDGKGKQEEAGSGSETVDDR